MTNLKLNIYKGFDSKFLEALTENPLVASGMDRKRLVLEFDKKTRKQLAIALIDMEDDDEAWATYEEYSLIRTQVEEAIADDGLSVVIYRNNIYPDYYPLEFELSDTLVKEITAALNGDRSVEISEECERFIAIYNSLVDVDGVYYGSFYNYEYDKKDGVLLQDYYPSRIVVEEGQAASDYNIFFNDDIETYLRDFTKMEIAKPTVVGIKSSDGYVSKRMQSALQAYCVVNNIRLVKFHEVLPEDKTMEDKLIEIARNDIGIEGFTGFRKIKFYKNPDIDKEVVELSQGQIIQEIIH